MTLQILYQIYEIISPYDNRPWGSSIIPREYFPSIYVIVHICRYHSLTRPSLPLPFLAAFIQGKLCLRIGENKINRIYITGKLVDWIHDDLFDLVHIIKHCYYTIEIILTTLRYIIQLIRCSFYNIYRFSV